MNHVFRNILLPFFPDSKTLKKHKWHKFVKVGTVIVTATSIYSILWLITLFYFIPQAWLSLPFYSAIYHISYLLAYIPINITSLLSRLPIYGTVFHALIPLPIIGPLALILILITFIYITPSLLYRLSIYVSQKFYLKKTKMILLVTILGIGLFVSYLWNYQQIVNEGSYLADEHCIKVNPLIIARKNSYAKEFNLIIHPTNGDDLQNSLAEYMKTAKSYQEAEKNWLSKQRTYLDSWNFNTFMPGYIKESAGFQYQMYEADYNSSNALTQAFEAKDSAKQTELSNKVITETNKSNAASDKYNTMWDSQKGKQDWQYQFITVPQSKCPAENNNIPDIPFGPSPTPTTNSSDAG